MRTYYPRTYEVTYLLGMLAGVMARTDRVGYVAANPVYGIPAAVNAYAQGLKTVRPGTKKWCCAGPACRTRHTRWISPTGRMWRSSMPGITASRKAPTRDYGLVRRMPDGSLQPLGLPVWRWDTFYIEIRAFHF